MDRDRLVADQRFYRCLQRRKDGEITEHWVLQFQKGSKAFYPTLEQLKSAMALTTGMENQPGIPELAADIRDLIGLCEDYGLIPAAVETTLSSMITPQQIH